MTATNLRSRRLDDAIVLGRIFTLVMFSGAVSSAAGARGRYPRLYSGLGP